MFSNIIWFVLAEVLLVIFAMISVVVFFLIVIGIAVIEKRLMTAAVR